MLQSVTYTDYVDFIASTICFVVLIENPLGCHQVIVWNVLQA